MQFSHLSKNRMSVPKLGITHFYMGMLSFFSTFIEQTYDYIITSGLHLLNLQYDT